MPVIFIEKPLRRIVYYSQSDHTRQKTICSLFHVVAHYTADKRNELPKKTKEKKTNTKYNKHRHRRTAMCKTETDYE